MHWRRSSTERYDGPVKVLVSDTSVLIDIERAALLERLFALPHTLVVPDLLYVRELENWNGPELVRLGLVVEELSGPEVAAATALGRAERSLSAPDTFAYILARARGWTLLTGDGALRRRAFAERLPMHGALWLFDEMDAHGVCPRPQLHEGLTVLSNHPRCRLPRTEILRRLRAYVIV